MRHSEVGICWEQCDNPLPDDDKPKKNGRPKTEYNWNTALHLFRSPLTYSESIEVLATHYKRAKTTIEHSAWKEFKKFLTYDDLTQGYFFKA